MIDVVFRFGRDSTRNGVARTGCLEGVTELRRYLLFAVGFLGLGGAVLAGVLGCAGETVVVVETVVVERYVEVEKEVPVTVVVEREVVKEVEVVKVVTATPTQVVGSPTPTAVPTPVPRYKEVFFVNYNPGIFGRAEGVAFRERIGFRSVDASPDSSSGSLSKLAGRTLVTEMMEHKGVLVVGEPRYSLMDQLRGYVESGGKLAVTAECKPFFKDAIEALFGITCAEMYLEFSGRGHEIAPMFTNLRVRPRVWVEYFTNRTSGAKCVAWVEKGDRKLCSAVQGNIGDGEFIFLNFWGIGDKTITEVDNELAYVRLLKWLAAGSASASSEARPAATTKASTLRKITTEERLEAVADIVSRYIAGSAGSDDVLDLLDAVAPELSVDERQTAIAELVRLFLTGSINAANLEEVLGAVP